MSDVAMTKRLSVLRRRPAVSDDLRLNISAVNCAMTATRNTKAESNFVNCSPF